MGWVSLLEDALERIQDNIRLAESALKNDNEFLEMHREASLRAINDAQAIFIRARKHLELATAPELDLAYENEQLNLRIRRLEHSLEVSKGDIEKARNEATNHYSGMQDKIREISDLKKRYRKLEKDFEKVAGDNFGSAVDAFSSPGMIKKHKPGC